MASKNVEHIISEIAENDDYFILKLATVVLHQEMVHQAMSIKTRHEEV